MCFRMISVFWSILRIILNPIHPINVLKVGRCNNFQMNSDRSGRGTVQRPVSEFRIELAGATGLEPAASCVTGRRSNQLNYAPACESTDFFLFPTTPSRSLPHHLAVP